MTNFSKLTSVAIEAALQAGALLRRGYGTDFEISSKPGRLNLVTEYDKASEKGIIALITKHFPDHAFLAEESGATAKANSPVTWIIDPLDGTVNFARQIPMFSVSIAAYSEGKVVSGVVYQPITEELFVAESGKGAYLNDKRIFVTKTDNFQDALFATGFPYNVEEDPLQCIEHFARLQKKGVPIRRLGSAAIDLAYVAAGRFDAYWEVGLHPWDMAAGKLLVEEAGGKVTHYDGSPHKILGYDTMVASNGLLHSQMVDEFKR